MVEQILVGVVVLASLLATLRMLMPASWRLYLAHKTQGVLPDKVRIWMVGSKTCRNCK